MHTRVAIIGSGFAGLGTAIRLKRDGIDDFVVLERAADVGGTWRDNTYPGCACDVQSHLYSFSFAPNPDWTRRFSRQPEISGLPAALRATSSASCPHVRFEHEVQAAQWDERARAGDIDTTARVVHGRRARVSGDGRAERAVAPDLPGARRVRGARVPLRALGPRPRSDAASAWR